MTNKLEDTYFQDPGFIILAEMRQEVRDKDRRITYDCLNTIVEGIKVACKKNHKLFGKRAKVSLLSVLRGQTSKQCKNCPDYDCEDDLKE